MGNTFYYIYIEKIGGRMKDRFKFRAKDIETGEWRYGYYAELPCGLGSSGVNGEYADIDAFILTYTKKQSALYSNAEPHEVVVGEQYKIDEKTLSQCTGLKDKNGKLIYEGDIVKSVELGNSVFYNKVVWDIIPAYGINSPGFQLVEPKTHACTPFNNELEVIGNIYENPELLEVSE